MYRYVNTLLLSCVCLGLASFAYGQDAQIQGRVSDPSGALIAKAMVRVVDQQTGIERKTATNDSGQYTLPGLTPSLYQIFVQAAGFSTAGSSAITLNVGQIAVLDFTLHVGSGSEVVTVSASDLGMNTTDGSVSTVIDRQFVENLPLNGRSFQSLLYLTPGITPNQASANSPYSQGQFVVNGQRGDANYWMVDGVSANIGVDLTVPGAGVSGAIGATNALGGTSALVSVDALQEFRVQTSVYAPEFGRSPGGQISIQTRSGTNQFHGTLFNYLRNGDLDATDWFADHNQLAKPLEIQNDFGGVVGGPIFKDKTFFFFSAEALRLILPQTFVGTVPDLASRAAGIPAVQPYLNMYPVPQPGAAAAGDGYVAYSATYSEPASADAYSLRIDHQLTRDLNVFARYNYAPSNDKLRGSNITAANTLSSTSLVTKTATVGATWAPSLHLINDLRFNYSVSGGSSSNIQDSFGGGSPFPATNLFPTGSGYTFQNSQILFYLGFGTNMYEQPGAGGKGFQHQYNLVDSISVQVKNHDLKFGVDYRHLTPTTDGFYYQLLPYFADMTSLITGKPDITIIDVTAPQTFLLHNLSAFGQDTWRINNRLNLTYGGRWDVEFVPTTTKGFGLPAITGFSTTNLSNLALLPLGTPAYKTHYGNFAPRISGAFRPTTNPGWDLVLRGGFGLY
jgi:hypothetical protein